MVMTCSVRTYELLPSPPSSTKCAVSAFHPTADPSPVNSPNLKLPISLCDQIEWWKNRRVYRTLPCRSSSSQATGCPSSACLSQRRDVNSHEILTVLSHFVNQLPAKAVQSGPILSRPGPSGGGGGKTFRSGSHSMIVWSACSVKSIISPMSSSANVSTQPLILNISLITYSW